MSKTQNVLTVVRLQVVKEEVEYYGSKKVQSPKDLEEVVRKFIGDADRETFLAVNLSSANKINSIHVISIGSLNQSIVHPRECFKAALLCNARLSLLQLNSYRILRPRCWQHPFS